MRRIALGLAALLAAAPAEAQTNIFITPQEGAEIRAAEGRYPLLDRALAEHRALVDRALAAPITAPQPGEAGGEAHERHKQNYREMQAAGVLYTVTGDARYARFVRDVLEKYAVLYPTLGPHPLNRNQSAGKLFHQALNDANWLVAAAVAYDCVRGALTPAERARFEARVFRPMAEWLSTEHPDNFDRIHNHGTWAAAAVGMTGYAIGDSSYVNRALYGMKRNRTGGFLRQLDLLFSPDGFYMEGPYYIRYALMPFYHFAEAVQRRQPEVGIYAYRDSILGKALRATLATAYPNGVFPPINDASRSMAVTAPEVTLATGIAYARYGASDNLLGAAAMQNTVVLNGAGLRVARDLAARATTPRMSFGSVELTDGTSGDRGGLGILRAGGGSMLLMKYGVHGEGHGHFDKLHFTFFDGGREVVPDYGFSRWLNVEPKSGGRYLPENDSYAMQTVAHNTVVVDQTSQNRANEAADEAISGERHYFDARDPNAQAMSARANRYYPGVAMQRTMFLLRDARLRYPVVVDLYRLASDAEHGYDLPLHFRGQVIATRAGTLAQARTLEPMGTAFGYQHVWREAAGRTDSTVSLTWLDGNRYYTATTSASAGTEVLMGRTGAADPSFNLISEPLMMVRRRAADHVFATAIEPHGYFNETQERSEQARPVIREVRVLGSSAAATVVEVTGEGGLRWLVMTTNGPASPTARHRAVFGGETYEWTGNFAVRGLQATR